MPDFDRWTSNGGDPSLNDINRVDRFFDALGSKETAYSTDHAEAELSFLLADWRDEIRDAPVTVPVTTRDAAAALNGGLTGRKRTRRSFALVGSVAAAVLCVGGFGAAVLGSEPGDAFYGIRSTLFGQEQVRDDQVALASAELQQVQQLIDEGQWEQAQDKLVSLSTTVQSIETPEQKQDLIQQWNALTYKVVEQDPAATLPPPGEPLPVLPDSPLTLLPVPDIDTTTSSSEATSTSETTTSGTTTSETTTSGTTTSGTTTSETPTSVTSTPETPGPEVVLPPPPTSAATPAPASTSSSATTTTTTTTTKSPVAEATSVTSAPASAPTSQSVVPQSVVPPPSTVSEAATSASEPPRQSQVTPSSSAALTTTAPPAGVSTASPSVASSQAEPTTTTVAPKRSSVEEQQPVTTTVVPPS
jgi:Anti-sigma-D factor RsdA to sigma factor binding region